MAITYKLIHNGRDGEAELRSDGRSVTRYTMVYRAATDSNYTEAATVGSGCPVQLRTPYPYDPRAFCQRVRPQQQEFSKRVWLITCSFSTEREASGANPLDDPAEIEWFTETFSKVYVKDRDGKAIVNSAGDPYDPPLEDDDERWCVSVRKNVASVPSWILQYRNVVNSDAFTIGGLPIDAGQAKLSGIRIGPRQNSNDVDYYTLSYTLQLSEDGWAAEILDAGFRIRNTADPALRAKILDANGDTPDSPVLLDGNGGELLDPTPDNAVFNTHHHRQEKPFSVLPMN